MDSTKKRILEQDSEINPKRIKIKNEKPKEEPSIYIPLPYWFNNDPGLALPFAHIAGVEYIKSEFYNNL
jgi:hypothetical protein